MCSVCANVEMRQAAGIVSGSDGPVAQSVEHLHGMEGVGDSSSPRSTLSEFSDWALGGFVAGEGCFCIARTVRIRRDGSARLKFVFQVTVASRDRYVLEALRERLCCGAIRDLEARGNGWLPASVYSIRSHYRHRVATIPFAESYLLPCAKRQQFQRWRSELDEYERAHPNRFGKGPSACSEPDCENPVRGRGLCRSHYYRATGY